MTKLKLPIIIALVAVAAIAGLMVSGVVGGKSEGPTKKHSIEPVMLAAPGGSFLVNLKDSGRENFLKFSVAIKLEPMDEEHWANWSGANAGGHGGATEAPGPAKAAAYAKYLHAVNLIAGGFSSEELLADDGRTKLGNALLKEFAAIAEVDEAEAKSTYEDPKHVGIEPPYHVAEVFFPEFVVSN